MPVARQASEIGALAGSVFEYNRNSYWRCDRRDGGRILGDQAGQIIGDKFGEWTNDLRAYGLPGKITAAWNTTVKWFTDSWDRGIANLKRFQKRSRRRGMVLCGWWPTVWHPAAYD